MTSVDLSLVFRFGCHLNLAIGNEQCEPWSVGELSAVGSRSTLFTSVTLWWLIYVITIKASRLCRVPPRCDDIPDELTRMMEKKARTLRDFVEALCYVHSFSSSLSLYLCICVRPSNHRLWYALIVLYCYYWICYCSYYLMCQTCLPILSFTLFLLYLLFSLSLPFFVYTFQLNLVIMLGPSPSPFHLLFNLSLSWLLGIVNLLSGTYCWIYIYPCWDLMDVRFESKCHQYPGSMRGSL